MNGPDGPDGPDGWDGWDGLDVPAWLAQVLTALLCGQDEATGSRWARRVHRELSCPGGEVSLRVVHDWHARTVVPMLAEIAGGQGSPHERRQQGEGSPHRAVQLLHERTLAGERVREDEWATALEPALREVYRHAYAYVDAFATAHASAVAYARAHDYTDDEVVEFADYYANLNTSANVRSYADANAIANAHAMAAAYASADYARYAETYPFAVVNAYAHAHANHANHANATGDAPDTVERRYIAYARLADGLAESLGRDRAGCRGREA